MAIDAPRRPVFVHVEQSRLVGRLMDCQILADYAEQAMRQIVCPNDSAVASVALDAIGKLRALLRQETGHYDREAAA